MQARRVAIFPLVALGLAVAAPGQAVDADLQATITSAVPSVEVKIEPRDWQPAMVRGTLIPGDSLRTGNAGKAELTFGNGTITRVSKNTQLTIEAKSNPITWKVRLGKIWMKVTAGKGGLRVMTPTAVATITGTELVVDVAPTGATQVSVLEGLVKVGALDGQGPIVDVSAGMRAGVAVGGSATPPVPVDVEHMRRQESDAAAPIPEGASLAPGALAAPAAPLTTLEDRNVEKRLETLRVDPRSQGGSPTTGDVLIIVK